MINERKGFESLGKSRNRYREVQARVSAASRKGELGEQTVSSKFDLMMENTGRRGVVL